MLLRSLQCFVNLCLTNFLYNDFMLDLTTSLTGTTYLVHSLKLKKTTDYNISMPQYIHPSDGFFFILHWTKRFDEKKTNCKFHAMMRHGQKLYLIEKRYYIIVGETKFIFSVKLLICFELFKINIHLYTLLVTIRFIVTI